MSYNYYEDYMREVLGYTGIQPNYNNTYYNPSNLISNNMQIPQYPSMGNNLNYMYPKIYNMINPIVCKLCDENTEEITEDLISKMTDKIYNTVISNIEADNIININIDISDSEFVNNKTYENNRNSMDNSNSTISSNTTKMPQTNTNNTNTCMNCKNSAPSNLKRNSDNVRRPQNQLLKDLIRILILNRLINNRNRIPMRPYR